MRNASWVAHVKSIVGQQSSAFERHCSQSGRKPLGIVVFDIVQNVYKQKSHCLSLIAMDASCETQHNR